MTAYSPIDIADDTIIVVNDYATLPLRAFLAHHGLDRAAGENIMRALADSRAYQGAIGYVPHCKLTLLADKVLEFQRTAMQRKGCLLRKTKRPEAAEPTLEENLRRTE